MIELAEMGTYCPGDLQLTDPQHPAPPLARAFAWGRLYQERRTMTTDATLRVVRVDPGREPTEATILDTLQAMQDVVGGDLEQFHGVALPLGRALAFHRNEDGLRLNLAPNRTIAGIQIVGTVLVVAVEESEEVSLTDSEVEDVVVTFRRWPKVG